MGNMRIWLIVAAVGALLLTLGIAADDSGYFTLLGAAGLVVGVGGALWDLATSRDSRRG